MLTKNTKIRFSLSIGQGNAVEETFIVKDLLPDFDSLSQSDRKERIQEEFEDWQNEKIDGCWEIVTKTQ